MKSILAVFLTLSAMGVWIGIFTENKTSKVPTGEATDSDQALDVRFYDDSKERNLSDIYSSFTMIPSTAGLSNYCENIIPIDNGYILTNLHKEGMIYVVGNDGTLLSKIDVNDKTVNPADVVYNELNEEIIVGDNSGVLLFYDLKGDLLRKSTVGFFFTAFNYSAPAGRYMFYSPLPNIGIEKGLNSIIITDAEFRTQHQIMPLPEICYTLNYLTSGRFQRLRDKVFYSPPLTSDIYELYYDGSSRLLTDLDNTDGKIEEVVLQYENRPINTTSAQKLLDMMPIKKFFVNDDLIVVDRMVNGVNSSILIRRKDERAVIIPNSMRTDGFGPSFMFAFLAPRFASSQGNILSSMSYEDYNLVLSQVKTTTWNEEMEKILVADPRVVIFDYKYNFDVLFEISAQSGTIDRMLNATKVQGNVEVFPVPATDELNVRWWSSGGEEMELLIYSELGSLVDYKKVPAQDGQTRLDVRKFARGAYVLSLMQASKLIHVQWIDLNYR